MKTWSAERKVKTMMLGVATVCTVVFFVAELFKK